ncbi:MAG: hypothetical protein WDN26_13890 [Chitinophagaceae bacterium]
MVLTIFIPANKTTIQYYQDVRNCSIELQNVEECDATEVDSSNAVGLIMCRPDCLGISLRPTTGDDSPQDAAHSTTAGLK